MSNLNLIKMKKAFLLAAFAVLGLVVVSCSADDNATENMPRKFIKVDLNDQSVFLKGEDTLPEGPGDDPIIVPPPPPRP